MRTILVSCAILILPFCAQAAADSTLTITPQPLCPGKISPYQYGQFIEYLCGLTLSMHAEQVFDRSFEGVPEYRVEFRKQMDRIERPWYPDGATHRGQFALDPVDSFNGKVSQRITRDSGDPCILGITQEGKCVRKGEPLQCSLYLRSSGAEGPPVRVALWGKETTYASAEFQPTQQWKRYMAVLTPSASDAQAVLTISFRGSGTVWIDQVSLMAQDNVFGWRRDVAEAIKELKPGMIRFGGTTTEGFDWKDTIGDPDKRVPFTTYWGGLEPGNAGLEEFVQLCRWVGAEPLICVRYTGRQPKDAADQVEYFNGPATSPMGKLRASNGHPEPYGVMYWQIGNELGDANYQQGVAGFCKGMKAVDPRIKLLGAYPSPGLLQHAGAQLDFICPHHYGAQLQSWEANVQECRSMIAKNAPRRDIRLGITEWNTTGGDWGLGRAMLWTLENALWCSRYHNFMHRHCDFIEIANRSNLAGSFCSGIIQTDNSGLYKTPTYYAQQLYATHAGQYPLTVKTSAGLAADRALDTSATMAADGRTVSIFVVNHTTQAQQRTLDLTAQRPQANNVEVWTLADTLQAGERDAVNSWREPQRIRLTQSRATLATGKLAYEFPPLSLTLLKISTKPQ